MPSLKPLSIAGLMALAFQAAAVAEGSFVPPNEGSVVLRRDRIPLEIEDIRRLSADAVAMARTIRNDKASDRRLAAQCLGLALALEPGNREARRVLSNWCDGQVFGRQSLTDIRDSLEHAMSVLDWLLSPEAGEDGRVLAIYLKDVISQVGRDDPRYYELRNGQERGDWEGWIPALAAYESRDPDPGPDPDPDPSQPLKKDFELTVNRAGVTIPMWNRLENPKDGRNWEIKPGLMTMAARFDPDRRGESFRMQVGGEAFAGQMGEFSVSMVHVLEKSLGALPGGLEVAISSTELEEALRSGQPQSVSTATVVLAAAAIRGVAPNPETIVIGKVDGDGNFLPSSDTWAKLRCLGSGQGQRLVVPAAARHYLESLLTMDNISLFLEYEVLMASDVGELLNATAAKPEDGLGSACQNFAEIQRVAKGNQVRTFVANSHVRRRLEEVVQYSPQHLSAALLLMQSKSARPFNISRQTLASEMRMILQPFEQVAAISWDQAAERNFRRLPIAEMVKQAKEKIDALEKYVSRDDREFYQQVNALFDVMRDYDRGLNARVEYDVMTGILTRVSANAERAFQAYAKVLEDAMQDR